MAQEPTDHRIEAALVLTVPEAEPLVGRFRSEHDPVASWGMPAHITINYPFIPGIEPSDGILSRLSRLFAAMRPFSFSLDHIGRFPNVVYLAPVPPAPFVQLVEQVAREFPESPPYGGKHRGSTPHLTVAQSGDSELLISVERDFSDAASGRLPLSAFASQVWLMGNRSGRWEKRVSFPLGAG